MRRRHRHGHRGARDGPGGHRLLRRGRRGPRLRRRARRSSARRSTSATLPAPARAADAEPRRSRAAPSRCSLNCRARASASRAWSSSSRNCDRRAPDGAASHPERVADAGDARARSSARTAATRRARDFFVERLAAGVAHDRRRLLSAAGDRALLSDFKTNEYANLLGGAAFEPVEENPMIGFRGASRYYARRAIARASRSSAARHAARARGDGPRRT